ncbi:hypothetical protein [Streptomyces malaysiensis]|uniref:hypothetical protein n=1 Tax=Streptomyces malaysiensis TaxID=92644 RepID=UPI000BFF1ABB|nr:hypothetical protein [Streptomyces malaysiensis]ATL81762.1 transposase [Streptomyces malaysiensis]
MSDTAISSQQTVLHLRVRRFFCVSSDCPKKTFAEQIPGLTFRHGRCTTLLRTIREAIALALGGRAGARLTELQAIGIGKDAMLRLIRALPDPEVGPVRVLGVDDFALKRGPPLRHCSDRHGKPQASGPAARTLRRRAGQLAHPPPRRRSNLS